MFRLNVETRNHLTKTMTSAFTPSRLRCYSGNQPYNPNDSEAGVVLVEFQIIKGWNIAQYGKSELNRSTEVEAIATSVGTIGWCRLSSLDGLYWIDGTIGVDVVISSTSVVSGQIVTLQRLTFIAPET